MTWAWPDCVIIGVSDHEKAKKTNGITLNQLNVTMLYDNHFSCPTTQKDQSMGLLTSWFCLFTAFKPIIKDENVAKIWTLSAQDIDDDEIVRMDYSHSTVMYSTLHPIFLQTCQLALHFQVLFWCNCEIWSELDTNLFQTAMLCITADL